MDAEPTEPTEPTEPSQPAGRADEPADPRTDPRNDLVTIRVPRAVLYGIAGLVLGLLIGGLSGFAIGRSGDSEEPAPAAAAPPAAAPSTQPLPGQPTDTAPAVVPDVATEGRPSTGPAKAPVTIVEFTDYQCPYCGAFARDTEGALLDAYDGKVRLVVRHFPITGIHQYAGKAAEAAECAFDQDRFWEYHTTLFAHQDALDEDSLRGYARELGLDTETFNRCLASGEKQAVVAADQADGQRYGVSATPTFFINGQKVIGAKPIDEFKQVIDALLKADG